MSELKIKGAITHILPIQTGTSQAGKEWQKLDFVIQTDDPKYPKSVAFTLFGEKTKAIENFAVGQVVNVFFNMESREFEGRWFTNVNAWKLAAAEGSTPAYNEAQAPPAEPPKTDAADGASDIPF